MARNIRFFRLSFIVVCCFVFGCSPIKLYSSTARIPFLSNDVVLDGVIGDEEWQDAAIVRQMWQAGGRNSAKPETVFYIKYDDDFLYVGAFCQEQEVGYPYGYLRGAEDDLMQDDAVQVVLGVADENILVREVLQMGGYEGAMGTDVAQADHYYQFTVNCEGSVSRSYNESLMKRPLFNSRATKSENGWCVEMRIPFSSCGLKIFGKKKIYANLFRSRPPEMLGWYYPGLGGYTAMPFGQFVFLPKAKFESRTIEKEITNEIGDIPEKQNEIKGKIGYYPLSGVIVGEVQGFGGRQGLISKLVVDDLGQKQVELNSEGSKQIIYEINPGSQPARDVHLEVIDSKSNILFESHRELSEVKQPEWFGTTAGLEYVDKKIPTPWKKPIISDSTIQLVDKTLGIGPYGLMDSIVDPLGELLAGDMEVVVEINGEPVVFNPQIPSIEEQGISVRVTSEAVTASTVKFQSQCRVEYDGFSVVKMRVLGVKPEDISKISLRVPMKKDCARYTHSGYVQNIGRLTGFGWESKASQFWLGSEDKGLSFNFDTKLFLSKNKRSQIQVIEEQDRTWMQFNFVDGLGQVKDVGHIFRFFLQPTPTKPVSLKKIHPHVEWKWEGWSPWQGYPDLSKSEELSKWTASLHKDDRMGLLYTCQGLAEDSPGFLDYAEDLKVVPEWIHYRRAFNPGKGDTILPRLQTWPRR